MSTVSVPSGQRFLLTGVDWQSYRRLRRLFDNRGLRLTYDRGALEIMSPLLAHESPADLLGRFVVALTEELGLPIKAAGSTTLRRRRRRRGLEPDRSWWIASEPRVRGKLKIDLRIDPPPDLALEIEVTRSALNRMGIYAALAVPEVWRFAGQALSFHVLGPNGQYTQVNQSLAFPGLTPADLLQFLALRPTQDENAIVQQFRVSVRQHHVKRGGGQSGRP